MEKLRECSTCEKIDGECTSEQVNECLRKSECCYCDNTRYHYPYGRDESRHCTNF